MSDKVTRQATAAHAPSIGRALLWVGGGRASALGEALAQEYRVLAQDGSGVDDLCALVDAQASGPVDVLAVGAGAAAALALAAQAPHRVGQVVLLAPAAGVPPPGVQPSAVTARTLVLAGASDERASAAGRTLKAALPFCHLAYVWGAGDDLAGDKSSRAIAIVRDFLERGEAFLVRGAV